MERPKFTRKQEDWICEVIGDWYLSWKKRIAPGQHRLGFAKEELKGLICGENKMSIGSNALMYGFIETQEFLDNYAEWECFICEKKRPNEFISVIKHDLDNDGSCIMNVKFCNDNNVCIEAVKNKEICVNSIKPLSKNKISYEYEEKFYCPLCLVQILHGHDPCTDSHWVTCDNKKCDEFGNTKTYIDIEDYRKKE